MTIYFYTYEADFSQPHETFEDAMAWFRDYDVDKIIEIEHDDDMNIVFAWDRTKKAELSVSLAEAFKTARDYVSKDEAEHAAMDRFAAKLPPLGTRYVEV